MTMMNNQINLTPCRHTSELSPSLSLPLSPSLSPPLFFSFPFSLFLFFSVPCSIFLPLSLSLSLPLSLFHFPFLSLSPYRQTRIYQKKPTLYSPANMFEELVANTYSPPKPPDAQILPHKQPTSIHGLERFSFLFFSSLS